jgi:MOSC domain-containing protein YiiM
MRSLRERLVDVPQIGTVSWIGLRPEHDAAMEEVAAVELVAGHGVSGDVAARGRPGGKRQVTLFQTEHLPVVASMAGVREVVPRMLRRNVLVSGINLLALVKLRFAIGDVILAGTGACAPCSKMDETIAPGAFQALRGHGGITARVERGGIIRIGDDVRALGAD